MRLLVDEDTALAELMARLRKAGHHVEASEKGALDEAVWQRGQAERCAVLTGDPEGFVPLSESTPEHHGLLVVYGERDPVRQMRAVDIAEAIEHVREVYGDTLRGVRLTLNEWRRSRSP